jgi:hypothetical protein
MGAHLERLGLGHRAQARELTRAVALGTRHGRVDRCR